MHININNQQRRIRMYDEEFKAIDEKIAYLSESLNDLLEILKDSKTSKESEKPKKSIEILEPPNRRWRAEYGKEYWYIEIAGNDIGCAHDNRDSVDDHLYSIGNYFKTQEDAEFEVERLKLINDLKDWSTNDSIIRKQYTFSVSYTVSGDTYETSRTEKHLNIVYTDDSYCSIINSGVREIVYFDSIIDAQNAIEYVGEDRILKYYFGQDQSK
jgi:hypothetical protein